MFYLLQVFHPLLFDIIPDSSATYCQVYPSQHLPIFYLQPGLLENNLWHFHFNLSRIFILPWVIQFWASTFSPTGAFYLALLFVTQMRSRTSHPGFFSISAVIELPLSSAASFNNAWCSSHKTNVLLITLVSHKVYSKNQYTEYVLDRLMFV